MKRLTFLGRHVLPRLLLVIVAFLGLHYALGLAVLHVAVRSGGSAVATRLEIAGARVSLLDHKIRLDDVRVANPRRPTENLLEADRCELDVAVAPLFRKRAVIERGRIDGFRFDVFASFAESDDAQCTTLDWLSNDDERARAWLAQVGRLFKEPRHHDFESLQRSEAVCASWSVHRAALAGGVAALKQRAVELDRATDAAEANHLRNAEFLQKLPAEIASIQRELEGFGAELDNVSKSLDTERRAIVAARQRDERRIRDELQIAPVDGSSLTAYLYRDQLARPMERLVAWLRWARQAAPGGSSRSPRTQRGEDLQFAGCRLEPSFLVRALQLQGVALAGNQSIKLSGTLSDVSNLPARHDAPIRLRLTSAGSSPLDVQATIDRTGDVPRDALLLDFQRLELPELCLAGSGDVALTVAPSVGALSISATVEGQQLRGDLQLVQRETRVRPMLRGELSAVPLVEPLQATLGKLDTIVTRVALQGTLDEPSYTLWSNLGPAVAEAMDRALQKANDEQSAAILADARRQVDERLTNLERQLAEERATLSSQLSSLSRQLDALARRQTSRDRLSAEQLGRRLPANSLLR